MLRGKDINFCISSIGNFISGTVYSDSNTEYHTIWGILNNSQGGTWRFTSSGGADTVTPFKSGGSLDTSSIIYNFNCGLSISATPKTDGIAIGYACGYNGNAEYYKGPATLSGATNVKALYNSGQVTGHSTPVYLFIGECKAGTPVSMSVASNGGVWTGGSVAVFIIPK